MPPLRNVADGISDIYFLLDHLPILDKIFCPNRRILARKRTVQKVEINF